MLELGTYDLLKSIGSERLSINNKSEEPLTDPFYFRKESFFYRNFDILLPVSFLRCAEKKLTVDFEKKTGIKVNKKVGLSTPDVINTLGNGLGLISSEVSYMNQCLSVGLGITNVIIAWKSKSGRIYQLTDLDIDCDDIEMWFHYINVADVYERLNPKLEVPFKMKNLNFELEILRMDINLSMMLYFKPSFEEETKNLEIKIDNYIGNFNEQSEKNDRKDGVVHNWKTNYITPLSIEYEIDMGSASFKFFKGLLKYFSSLNCFEKVVVE